MILRALLVLFLPIASWADDLVYQMSEPAATANISGCNGLSAILSSILAHPEYPLTDSSKDKLIELSKYKGVSAKVTYQRDVVLPLMINVHLSGTEIPAVHLEAARPASRSKDHLKVPAGVTIQVHFTLFGICPFYGNNQGLKESTTRAYDTYVTPAIAEPQDP